MRDRICSSSVENSLTRSVGLTYTAPYVIEKRKRGRENARARSRTSSNECKQRHRISQLSRPVTNGTHQTYEEEEEDDDVFDDDDDDEKRSTCRLVSAECARIKHLLS